MQNGDNAGIILKGIRIGQIHRTGRRSDWLYGEQVLLERKVAIKRLHHELAADDAVKAAFISAGRQAAVIVHPSAFGIINISSEHSVIVSEWCDDPSIADLPGKIPVIDAIGIAIATLDCLAGLHATGRAHGNLIPGNMFLSTATSTLRIGDFFQPPMLANSAFTPGLDYCSPLIRSGGDADWRSDLYSLGKIMLSCLNHHDASDTTIKIFERLAVDEPLAGFASPLQALEELRQAKAGEERLHGLATRAFIRRHRQYRRIPAEISVAVKKRSASPVETGQILSRIQDIGENGVFVATEQPMPVGSIVELDFSLVKDGGRIHAFGLVRWLSEPPLTPGMGVQFVEVDEQGIRTLRDFVQKKNPEQ
jgi:PilZ domain.